MFAQFDAVEDQPELPAGCLREMEVTWGGRRVGGSVMPVKIEGSENIRDIFCILHDGSLISHATDGGELGLEVEIRYLAERIDPSFRKFEVRLFGVSDVQFSTWPGDLTSEVETLTDVGEIFRAVSKCWKETSKKVLSKWYATSVRQSSRTVAANCAFAVAMPWSRMRPEGPIRSKRWVCFARATGMTGRDEIRHSRRIESARH